MHTCSKEKNTNIVEGHDLVEDSARQANFGDGMLRPSPNHGTLRLPNDDE